MSTLTAVLSAYAAMISGLAYAGHRTRWKSASIRRGLLTALIPLGVALVFAIGLRLTGSPTQAETARANMERMAQQLDAADRKGDGALAASMLDDQIALMRMLNDAPESKAGPLRNCLLAAVQLGDGITAVMRGGRWFPRDRFETSLKECS